MFGVAAPTTVAYYSLELSCKMLSLFLYRIFDEMKWSSYRTIPQPYLASSSSSSSLLLFFLHLQRNLAVYEKILHHNNLFGENFSDARILSCSSSWFSPPHLTHSISTLDTTQHRLRRNSPTIFRRKYTVEYIFPNVGLFFVSTPTHSPMTI